MDLEKTPEEAWEEHRRSDAPHLLREVMLTGQALIGVFSREVGVPASRLAVLRLLAVGHPQALGIVSIARSLDVDAAAITRQVKVMAGQGLVERVSDPMDGRRCEVRLTEAGLRLFHEAHRRAHALEESLMQSMSGEDAEAARRTLVGIRSALEKMEDGEPNE